MAVDTHAHVFRRELKLADTRRYAPDYDATLTDYLVTLDASGITHGVLVQPSFLGTDNSFMLHGLQAARDRLRGIVMIDPATTKEELVALDRAGVVGLRLNLIGKPIPAFDAEPWPAFFKIVADLGWQIEVHREARDLEGVLGPLLRSGVIVVVDHFGRPDTKLGVDDPGFRFLLSAGAQRLAPHSVREDRDLHQEPGLSRHPGPRRLRAEPHLGLERRFALPLQLVRCRLSLIHAGRFDGAVR
jgi:predicted TIM-barrel fold metal-dependent hydrolase